MNKDVLSTLGDNEIIDLFWSRNEYAIKAADIKYGKYLFTIGRAFLKDPDDIEYAKNDTYLTAWNKIPPERPRVLAAFLARLMRCAALDRYKALSAKKRSINESLSDGELICLSDGRTADEEYEDRRLGELINEYLHTLTERQRYIFIGRYYMGRSAEKLAKSLKVGKSTVHRELEHIKAGLRLHLEKNGAWRE